MIRIVTDSTSNMPPSWTEEYGIQVVPLQVMFGLETYKDGHLSNEEFYARLRTAPQLPTTSQPAVGDFYSTYEKLTANGDQVVSLHISSKLSGTYSNAAQAAAMFPEGAVTVLDTNWASIALAFMAREAARAAQAGKSVPDVVATAKALDPKLHLYLALETLENLRRGGRIGAAAAFIGGLLNFKPILSLRQGALQPVERPRSKKAAIRRMLEIVEGDIPKGAPIHCGILHAHAPVEMEELTRQARERFNVVEVVNADVGPTIGTHVGEGTVGIICYPQ
ncbi:MAG: DegV family protein [Anaerolineae bacterium]|nr:DegV family protein [Anaerolineae bacterium]